MHPLKVQSRTLAWGTSKPYTLLNAFQTQGDVCLMLSELCNKHLSQNKGELVKNVSHQLLGIESGIDTSSFSAVTENPESETHRKMQLARSLGMKLVIFWHCLIMVVKHWMPTATVPMHLKSTDIGHSTASLMHKCLSPFIFWLLDYNKWCHYNFYWWHWMQPNWPLICHTKHHACCLIRPHCQRDLEAKW